MVLIVLGAIGATAPAAVAAGTGGYPYAHYHGPGTRPAAYEWTDSHGNAISPYGYYFRNCTDFAAWKLATTNKFGDYRGLHNGGEWGAYARERHYKVNMSPKPGSIAWWSPSGGLGKWGHVAWVQAVKGNSVTIQEYNYRVPSHPGTWDRRTIARTAVSGYIHFKDLKGGSSSSDNPVGHFDKVGSPGAGRVRVAGWAFDPNAKTRPLSIHAYVGGKAGTKGAKGYTLGRASKRRGDVGKAFKRLGIGAQHGFDVVFKTGEGGKQAVCVYAINVGPGSSSLLGCRTTTIRKGSSSGPASTPLQPVGESEDDRLEGHGDFNGDGRADVAALYAYPHNTAFNVFAGTPSGLASSWERGWTSSTDGWDWSRTK